MMRKRFKLKNIIWIAVALTIVVLMGIVLSYIHKQNVAYQRLGEERMTEKDVEEEIPAAVELSEPEQHTTGTVETEFRDSTIMIF